MKLEEKILECINNMDASDLIQLHNNYCDAVNDFDSYIYSMEDLDTICNGQDAHWIACRIFYGDFNPNDDYITFSGYGNFISLNDHSVLLHIFDVDIANHIIANGDSLYNDEIQNILDEYEKIADKEKAIKDFYSHAIERMNDEKNWDEFAESTWSISFMGKSIEIENYADIFNEITDLLEFYMKDNDIEYKEEK